MRRLILAATAAQDRRAEQLTIERIIAHVLNDASAVGVCVRLRQLILGGNGKSSQAQGLNLIALSQVIPSGFVGENGI